MNPFEGEICAVCQETLDNDLPTATTPCNHRLHSSCFLSAALASDTCPVCRASLYPDEQGEQGEQEEGEIDISAAIGEETLREITEEVSRLAASRGLRAEEDNVHVIEIEEPPNLRRTRLIYAIFKASKEGDVDEVRRLINNNTELSTAENDVFDTLLHQAIFSGNELLLRYLIVEAAIPVNSINNFRMTPLHYAVSSGINSVSLLLNSGAYVDVQDSAGKTPLMFACSYNNVEVTKLLLDRGASTRTFDSSGDTCMHSATRGKCLAVLKVLLRQSRSDPNFANFLDETPLHFACASGSHTAVRFLLESGGDPAVKTKAGKKPVDYVPLENTRLRLLLAEHS